MAVIMWTTVKAMSAMSADVRGRAIRVSEDGRTAARKLILPPKHEKGSSRSALRMPRRLPPMVTRGPAE